ncbi:hypothetical protein CH381_08420 [Leptospira sp. mixed culture ATI2-C-A1]|nr:hypothetical protein CH381_08420 [Leptospira sp. mixed culture ATI2-C-A1]
MSKQNSTLSMARMRFSSYQLVLTEIKSWKQIENIFTKKPGSLLLSVFAWQVSGFVRVSINIRIGEDLNTSQDG